jgi:glucose dehydrogenase
MQAPNGPIKSALLRISIGPLFAQEVDWAYHGHDQSNTRYQNIDQIAPSNVSQLKLAR